MAKDVFLRYRESVERERKGISIPSDGPAYGTGIAPLKSITKTGADGEMMSDKPVPVITSGVAYKEEKPVEEKVAEIKKDIYEFSEDKTETVPDEVDENIKICNYDKVISLGFNCEISFALKDYYGKLDSYPYSWCYSADRELLLSSFDHMDEILTGHVECLPESNMFKCNKFQMSFHAKTNRDQLAIDGVEQPEKVKESLIELRSRVAHLVDKMNNLFEGNQSTLFIYKLRFTSDWEEDNKFILRMIEKLNELYKTHNFVLLVVVESINKYKVTLTDNEQLKIRVIDNFSGFYNVQGSTDHTGWSKILDEFSHYKGKQESISSEQAETQVVKENPFFARSRDIIGF